MRNDDTIYRLIYVSRHALVGPTTEREQEVSRILAASRRNNARDGITGALLFSDDCFAQVLEGGSARVHDTFERIQIDPRHRDTVVLECGPYTTREFGDWSMAYIGAPVAGGPGYAALAAPRSSGPVLDLLRGVVMRTSAA